MQRDTYPSIPTKQYRASRELKEDDLLKEAFFALFGFWRGLALGGYLDVFRRQTSNRWWSEDRQAGQDTDTNHHPHNLALSLLLWGDHIIWYDDTQEGLYITCCCLPIAQYWLVTLGESSSSPRIGKKVTQEKLRTLQKDHILLRPTSVRVCTYDDSCSSEREERWQVETTLNLHKYTDTNSQFFTWSHFFQQDTKKELQVQKEKQRKISKVTNVEQIH